LKTITAAVLAPLVCVVAVIGVASATELGIITGPEQGVYNQLGQDLKKLVKPGGIELTVLPSRGAVDNVVAGVQRPGIQLGIVQSDVLKFVAEIPSNPAVTEIARSIRMVFPLHDEEVHIVARREIGALEQLAGKRVAIGAEGSGTYLTARLLFKLTAVVPGEMLPLDAGEALAELKAGRIDALVYVAGYPVRLLQDRVTAGDGLSLIGLSQKSVLEAYAPAEIPGNVYGWQTTPVSTVAVKAVLVSFDVHGANCDTIGRFALQMARGLDWLRSHGHPKWKQIDLDYQVKGWEQYDCVRTYLARSPSDGAAPAASPDTRNPIADAIKGVLGGE
jgi:uncharacterized protein